MFTEHKRTCVPLLMWVALYLIYGPGREVLYRVNESGRQLPLCRGRQRQTFPAGCLAIPKKAEGTWLSRPRVFVYNVVRFRRISVVGYHVIG